MRKAMWEHVSSRSHDPLKVFPFGPDADEVMLHGTVKFERKDGKTVDPFDWAARAKLKDGGDGLRMNYYQVYLVSRLQTETESRDGETDLRCVLILGLCCSGTKVVLFQTLGVECRRLLKVLFWFVCSS